MENVSQLFVTLLAASAIAVIIFAGIYRENLKKLRITYQKLFDNNPLPIYVLHRETLRILAVNPAMCNLYGYTESEFLNMTALDIRPPEDRERFKAFVNQKNKPENQGGQAIHCKKDGSCFTVNYTFHRLPPASSQAVLVTITDIDQTLKDKARIGDLLSLYEAVNKATNDVIWEFNLAEGKLYWMQGFEETYGYSKALSPADFWSMERVHPDDRAKTISEFRAIVSNCRPDWIVEYRYICADGTWKYVRDKGCLLSDAEGKPVRLIGAMQDIDRQKRYEQQLLEQNKQLRDIAWTNSHEVRRPLSNLLGLTALLTDAARTGGDVQELTELVAQSCKELDEAVASINARASQGADYGP
ncbi:PAS domain-containing protein [Pedobacter sp. SYP-B3415]|uniref:PAS domain-containing protein n=1 Tax=Pedobacter sp. SYP-B3415 TaxID=2496641 RepID=UPI00101C4F12|nr:PAS domain-containing protein [Pedobacter sp. SYP-B3415]